MNQPIGFSPRHQAAFLLGQAMGLLMCGSEELERAGEKLAADQVRLLTHQLHTVANRVFSGYPFEVHVPEAKP